MCQPLTPHNMLISNIHIMDMLITNIHIMAIITHNNHNGNIPNNLNKAQEDFPPVGEVDVGD